MARASRAVALTGRNASAGGFAQPVKSSDRSPPYLPVPTREVIPRLGLAISRKVAKSAVARNRIKRIARDSFRHHQAWLGDLDCVVMGRSGLTEQDNAVLFASLQRHWRRLAHSCAPS